MTKAEKILNFIKTGGTLMISTATSHSQIDAKVLAKFEKVNLELIKSNSKDSLFLRRGKHWDCIDYCQFTRYWPEGKSPCKCCGKLFNNNGIEFCGADCFFDFETSPERLVKTA